MTLGTIPEWISAIATIAALAAIKAAVNQMQLQSRQLHRELESQYTQRFWVLWDSRPHEFFRTNIIDKSDQPWIESYLALSNDQIELRERGRVTDDTWDFWVRDIIRFCYSYDSLIVEAQNGFTALSKMLSSERTRDLVSKSETEDIIISSGPVYDPLSWNDRKRKKQGLTAPK